MARLELEGRSIDIDDLVIAGWTGRDVDALHHHIEELKAIGVQPPSKVPLYYRAGAALLTQADRIQVVGDDTSGEAEPVLVGTPDRLWVTVGADHTDRKLEAYVAVSGEQSIVELWSGMVVWVGGLCVSSASGGTEAWCWPHN